MKYPIIYFLFFIGVSCTNRHNETTARIKEEDSAFTKYVNSLPPYSSVIHSPTDTLLLGFTKGATEYDTSWTLLVSKTYDVIHCRYNQILPSTVIGFNDYLDESMKLLYHEGFSFEITKIFWDSLINSLELKRYIVRDPIRYTGCFHCPRYTAYYDSKLIVSSKADYEYLTMVDSILYNQLIKGLFKKKNNPIIQLKK